VAAGQALEMVGLPEARLSISQAIIYICEASKSNSVVMAMEQAFSDAEKDRHDPVPVHLRDTHYAGHTRIGSGEGYRYPHDYPGHYVKQDYAPLSVQGRQYYIPSDQGFEVRIRDQRARREQILKMQEERQ